MNPQPPKLYFLIKLHKIDRPIRPVVSFTTAPSVKLSKKLIPIIKFHSNFQPEFSIKNSLELIDKVKDIIIPNNSFLLSFDVKNLFPSVPPNEVIQITSKLLFENKCVSIIREDILNLLQTCLEQNYFEFNGVIYKDGDSLAMGNPLSPLSAEILMDNLEKRIKVLPSFRRFLFWYRYVDDVFACFVGTRRQLDLFYNSLNKLHSNIKFTIELESDN